MPTRRKVPDALKQAAKAFGPGEYTMAGRPIVCPHCGHRTFEAGEAQLNNAVSTFFKLDWLDETATILACAQCSHILWFGKHPTRL
jgi:DNA-directed RNA polymerase subunit RPC12/RpoP